MVRHGMTSVNPHSERLEVEVIHVLTASLIVPLLETVMGLFRSPSQVGAFEIKQDVPVVAPLEAESPWKPQVFFPEMR